MPATDMGHLNRKLRQGRRPILVAALCGLAGAVALAAEAPAPPEWIISADGGYIVHLSANVAWPRCVEGMRWSGHSCEGRALMLDHAAALALAQRRAKAEGVAWRLPQFKELQGLARLGARPADAMGTWLPNNPPGWCWSATASVDTRTINEYSYENVSRGVTSENMARVQFLHAWAVDTTTGEARKDALKRSPLLVRLVRPLD
jgi:hypothetical protein